MSNINLITLTIRRTPKSAGVLAANDYLLSGITSLEGHDYATVRAQAGLDDPDPQYPNGSQQRLNIGGYFTKGNMSDEIDADTGLTTNILPFHCNTVYPGYTDVTVANAYDRYNAARTAHAAVAGISEFHAWWEDYVAANYTTTWSANAEASDFDVQWWLDHELNWSDPLLNKPTL